MADPTITISVRLDPKLVKDTKRQAVRARLTFQAFVAKALRQMVEQEKAWERGP